MKHDKKITFDKSDTKTAKRLQALAKQATSIMFEASRTGVSRVELAHKLCHEVKWNSTDELALVLLKTGEALQEALMIQEALSHVGKHTHEDGLTGVHVSKTVN